MMFASFSVNAFPELKDDGTSVFEKRVFSDGNKFFANRDYVLSGVPAEYLGYEFLANNGGSASLEDVTITVVGDGTVFIIVAATETVPSGWTLVNANMCLTLSTVPSTALKILSKNVSNGESLKIPNGSGFVGATLLAKGINLQNIKPEEDARLSQLHIDGVKLNGFDKNKKDYIYYLPYTSTSTPVVTAVANQQDAVIESIVSAKNILSSDKAERTTVLNVKSPDKRFSENYNIQFEVLSKLDLFLCIGQSNMAGAARMEDTDKNIINKAFLLNKNNVFEEARNSMNRYANILSNSVEYYGLTYSFADTNHYCPIKI